MFVFDAGSGCMLHPKFLTNTMWGRSVSGRVRCRTRLFVPVDEVILASGGLCPRVRLPLVVDPRPCGTLEADRNTD
mgnify:CR=1 FL=1